MGLFGKSSKEKRIEEEIRKGNLIRERERERLRQLREEEEERKLEANKLAVETEILLNRDMLNPYSEWYRAYPVLEGNCYKVAYIKDTTVIVEDGKIYSGAIDFYEEIKEYANEIYQQEETWAKAILHKSGFIDRYDFCTYMALDTEIFHYIYNDPKYRKTADIFNLAFHYSPPGENIYTNKKCSVEDVKYSIDGIETYVRLLMEKYNLNEEYAVGVAWKLLRLVSKEYFVEKWIEDFKPTFDIDFKRESIDLIIKEYVRNDTIEPLSYDSMVALTYYLIYIQKVASNSFPDEFSVVVNSVVEAEEERQLLAYAQNTLNYQLEEEKEYAYTIDDVDMMTGEEFEEFIAEMYGKMGYKTEKTVVTGDQGVDVIAEKRGKRFAIQAKCYSGTVGNSAVQEVVAGKIYYGCDKGIVITNSVFSKSAIALAEVNNVILIDRNILKEKIKEVWS